MNEIFEPILKLPELLSLSTISLFRIFTAHIVSVTLAIAISYIAISHSKLERILIGIIDIMQSIPVLSFVPTVMVFLTKFGRIGAEIAALILITTGMIWNLIFSYYSSLKSIPEELKEASKVMRLGTVEEFLLRDIPYSIPGLVWNSMLSFGGGWYFLMYCETITVGEIEVKLPGIGSVILKASEEGNLLVALEGILSILIIVALSFLFLWIPLETWSRRFVVEEESAGSRITSSPTIMSVILDRGFSQLLKLSSKFKGIRINPSLVGGVFYILVVFFLIALGILTVWLMLKIPLRKLIEVPISIFFSLIRVIVGVALSSAIAVPLGLYVGLKANILARMRLAILVLSCLPAPALIPVIFSLLLPLRFGTEINAIVVIMLSSIWYIFFNTAGGVASIPREYFDLAKIIKMSKREKFAKVIIPGASKNMIVGFITAWGGAWNGTFVAEFIEFSGQNYALKGIGSLISESAKKGQIEILIFSTISMALVIFAINVFLWRRIINFILGRH